MAKLPSRCDPQETFALLMHHHKGAGGPAPTGHGVWNDLLVIADAAAQIAHRHETHLRNRRRGRARLRKHVADFCDFTFRLLPGGVQFQPKRLASGILEGSLVSANWRNNSS